MAFGLEALALELSSHGHELDEDKFINPVKTNKGFYVAHRLIQAFGWTDGFAEDLPARLVRVFELRNGVAHFESDWRDKLEEHPAGTLTAAEVAQFTLEESLRALAVGREVIARCAASVQTDLQDAAAADVAREFAGVLEMLDETIRIEGVSIEEDGFGSDSRT